MSTHTDRLDHARRQAGRVLWIEQVWPALLPGLFLIGAFALFSLATVPQRLPVWLHWLLLAALVAASVAGVWRGVRVLSSPNVADRDRRIERASSLRHRPLLALADRPALATGSDALWRAHLGRTEASLGPLGAGLPHLAFRKHDRNWIGRALLAALALAAILAGTAAPLRLLSGFWPAVELPLGPRPNLQAWITPPDYTGGAPVFLSDPSGRYVVPAGSRLSVSLTGSDARPHISGASDAIRRLSERSWSADRTVPSTDAEGLRVRVSQSGYTLANWRIVAQPAPALSVSWSAKPGADKEIPWRMRLPWTVSQAYGVRTLAAEIRLAVPGSDKRVLRVPISLPGVPKDAHGVATPDLSADPWAGAEITVRLVATDTGGHEAHSADARMTLPSRPFRNPLARAVLDARRRLATGAEAPAASADDLAALGDTPGAFAQDTGLFLNLSSVASLLRYAVGNDDEQGASAIPEATDRLWSLALALEDGLHNDREGARATADIRHAQDRLSAQIEHMRQLGAAGQNDTERDELKRRIAELAQAIQRKMQAMAAQAAREHKAMPDLPESMLKGGQNLGQMLKQMQEQAASGHGDEAMHDLSRMQQMLDHMRMATPQDLRSAAEQAEAKAQARDQMQAVQDLVHRQTGLLDSAQRREGDADRAQQAQQNDGEDAAPADPNGAAPDAATRALLQQLGIPLDQNSAEAGSGGPSQSPPPPPAKPADKQSQDAARTRDRHDQGVLARAVDELAQEFTGLTGKKAAALDEAARQMRQAQDALSHDKDADAAGAQAKALAALQQGRNQMSAGMRGGRSGGTGLALMPGNGSDGDGTGSEDMQSGQDGDGTPDDDARIGKDDKGPHDPLGRPAGAGNGPQDEGEETHVPGQDPAACSRQIEEELRRRDSDRTRPQNELDYLDRLLKSF